MKLNCAGNSIGDKCTYTCIPGYTLVGANERECRANGQWSHSLPYCKGIMCIKVCTPILLLEMMFSYVYDGGYREKLAIS